MMIELFMSIVMNIDSGFYMTLLINVLMIGNYTDGVVV